MIGVGGVGGVGWGGGEGGVGWGGKGNATRLNTKSGRRADP